MKNCGVNDLENALENPGGCQLIDVRELAEYRSEHIEGVELIPLSVLAQQAAERLEKNKPLYVVCRSGSRACQAADQLSVMGFSDIRVVEGGLKAWQAAGKKVVFGESRVWSLDRQVRFAAGLFALTGILLSWALHPYWIALSVFVAGGLIFSGATDTCGMAMVLNRMPWNRSRG